MIIVRNAITWSEHAGLSITARAYASTAPKLKIPYQRQFNQKLCLLVQNCITTRGGEGTKGEEEDIGELEPSLFRTIVTPMGCATEWRWVYVPSCVCTRWQRLYEHKSTVTFVISRGVPNFYVLSGRRLYRQSEGVWKYNGRRMAD